MTAMTRNVPHSMGEISLPMTAIRRWATWSFTCSAPLHHMKFLAAASSASPEDLFPIYNLVWIGIYNGKKGLCAYTGGMRYFGYDEMEVLDSQADVQTLHEFLSEPEVPPLFILRL